MRRVVAILFLTVVLFTATPMQQLLKLPVLVQHYYEHKNDDTALTLLSFLELHYLSSHDDNDGDNNRDQQLPFKTTDINVAASFLNALPGNNTALTISPNITTKQGLTLADETIVSSQYLSAIWQPPKTC